MREEPGKDILTISVNSIGRQAGKVIKKVIDRDGNVEKVVVVSDMFVDNGNR